MKQPTILGCLMLSMITFLSPLLTIFSVRAVFGFSAPDRPAFQPTSNKQYHNLRRHGARGSNSATQLASSSSSSSGVNGDGYSIRDSWALIVLGDLHLQDDMTSHWQARDDCLAALRKVSLLLSPPPPPPPPRTEGDDDESGEMQQRQQKQKEDEEAPITVKCILSELEQTKAGELSAEQLEVLVEHKRHGDLMKSFLVSLGDLGRKDIRHEPGDAGTTKSFQDAKAYLDSFEGLPYDIITGNHDLEGLDEFPTSDEENLQAWMDVFEKSTPQFSRVIGERTLLLGLSTVRFRDAPYSSHEIHIDDEQLEWFVDMVQAHSAEDGWKILVFSHAPIMGSGLRVLQSVHVRNGCAWLNHCSEETRNLFIRTVHNNPQIKLWFSGHFHLSHDFEDSISTVGSCTFVQVGVMGPASTRDGRRQTRLVQGCSNRLKVYTINHHEREQVHQEDDNDNDNGNDAGGLSDSDATVRLDVDINVDTGHVHVARVAHDFNHNDWFQAYTPRQVPCGSITSSDSLDSEVCWWHMKDGRVIGLHQGQLVEYDCETLSPLGIVVDKETLGDREVVVVENGTALVLVNTNSNEENDVNYDSKSNIEVVHPNEDGSYWRKYQRNKRVRQEEKAREEFARLWFEQKQER